MKAIKIALAVNAAIAVSKFVAFAFTGSASMGAEAIHSVADTANQGFLLVNRARLAAGVMTALGVGVIWASLDRLQHPEPVGNLMWAFGILSLSIALETVSITQAFIAAQRVDEVEGELLVLLVEDGAALFGLAVAVLSVAASAQTGNPRYDALGGLAIGLIEALSGLTLTIKLWRDDAR